MKKVIIGLVGLLVVGGVASLLWPSINSTNDLTFINYQDVFSLEHDEYFVYFYNEDCRFCIELEPYIMKAHRAGVPIYVVDMVDPANANAWFDWDAHHALHTTVVGEVVDGEEVYAEDFDPAQFPEEEGWAIVPQGEQLVARLNRADFNRNPQSPEEIEVAGTPSMIHIVNGQGAGFDMGVAESRRLLATYAGLEQPLFED